MPGAARPGRRSRQSGSHQRPARVPPRAGGGRGCRRQCRRVVPRRPLRSASRHSLPRFRARSRAASRDDRGTSVRLPAHSSDAKRGSSGPLLASPRAGRGASSAGTAPERRRGVPMATEVDQARTVEERATATVRDVTYDLLRAYGLTTIFGNVGSTEEPFLANFPPDFRYVLGLQEASVIAMADGFAQATRGPALVNLHTGAGVGNAMGNLGTAFQNKTPLIVTAGQQPRKSPLLEPYLTNTEPTMLPRPWVKWAYQPARAQDVPAAFMRAIATALQPPAGPVFLSLPLDDWDKLSEGPPVVRTVGTRVAPDPARLGEFADALRQASSPVVIYG